MVQGTPLRETPGNEDYIVTGEETEMGGGSLSNGGMVNIP